MRAREPVCIGLWERWLQPCANQVSFSLAAAASTSSGKRASAISQLPMAAFCYLQLAAREQRGLPVRVSRTCHLEARLLARPPSELHVSVPSQEAAATAWPPELISLHLLESSAEALPRLPEKQQPHLTRLPAWPCRMPRQLLSQMS